MKILRFKWLWTGSFLCMLAFAGCLFFPAPGPVSIALAAASIVCMLLLFFAVIRPMMSVQRGIELLGGSDFGSRLARVRQPDADRIVTLFNSLMGALRQERLKQEEKNALLARLINASPMGVVMFDFDGRITDVNPGAERFLSIGASGLSGKRAGALPGPIGEALRGLKPGESRTVNLGWCGGGIFRCSRLWFADRGFRREFFMIESLTEEVRKAEKEAFSKVIRVMAHEVNNTMAGVRPALETLGAIYGDGGEGEDDDMLRLIGSCSSRCISLSHFVSQYAEVVKLPAPKLTGVNLVDWLVNRKPFLESIVKGVMGECPCGLMLKLPEEESVTVKADSVLLEQVLVNIVKNAAESILMSPRRETGRIEVALLSSPAGITVSDNGVGISPKNQAELFTSFFTTKPGGHGLGLMSVAEILTSHQCRFSLLPATPQGAIFSIIFP